MMLLPGYIAAVLIGVSLGLIGSGGSILTVPVLVYLLHISPLQATASSLFIVGTTGLVGGIKAYYKKQVNRNALLAFGLPSIVSVWLARQLLLPAIPGQLFSVGSLAITKNMFLMLLFALLMLAAAIASLTHTQKREAITPVKKERHNQLIPLAGMGFIVGLLTGILGAGGGFLIVPFLVFFRRLPIKTAIGTSLLIIAINSLLGFVFSLYQFAYNWPLLLSFTAFAIAGIAIGSRVSDRIPGAGLKKGFGWFLLAMAIYVIVKELWL